MLQQLVSAIVVAGGWISLAIAESVRPLRRAVEPKTRRVARNVTLAVLSLALMTLIQTPVLLAVARWSAEHRIGLLQQMTWTPWVETLVAVVLLDYTLWWWHWASHRVPFLWRFHLVHHVDRDLDASTALRFHFGELTLSIGYRAGQIALLGATLEAVWVWQTILFASILFHHSNLRLPAGFERVLVRFVVTPRMHGIHHSNRQDETDTNWSSLLSCWDFLHRTIRLDVPQETITIGVPAYSDPRDVTIGRLLTLPFVRQRQDWRA